MKLRSGIAALDRNTEAFPRMKGVYKLLFDPGIYSGLSREQATDILFYLHERRYEWSPGVVYHKYGRKVHVMPERDVVLAGAIRDVLSGYFSRRFSPHNHGFRHNHSQRTLLDEVKGWRELIGLSHFDIWRCYDSITSSMMIEVLERHIDDTDFLSLIRSHISPVLPTGSPLSPMLLNIYLDAYDKLMALDGYYVRYADNILIGLVEQDDPMSRIRSLREESSLIGLRMIPKPLTFMGVELEVEDGQVHMYRPANCDVSAAKYYESLKVFDVVEPNGESDD